jgi:hypothetical protein
MCIAVRFTLLDLFSTLYPSLGRASHQRSSLSLPAFLSPPLLGFFRLDLCWAASPSYPPRECEALISIMKTGGTRFGELIGWVVLILYILFHIPSRYLYFYWLVKSIDTFSFSFWLGRGGNCPGRFGFWDVGKYKLRLRILPLGVYEVGFIRSFAAFGFCGDGLIGRFCRWFWEDNSLILS